MAIKTRQERDEDRKAKVRQILAGKTSLADITANEVKRLVVILCREYLDTGAAPVDVGSESNE